MQVKDWLESLYPLLGKEDTDRYYDEMLEGNTIELDDMQGSFDGIVEMHQEVISFGFDRQSLGTGIVSGVVPGLPAGLGGLKNGDRILWYSRVGACIENKDRVFKLTIDREGKLIDISFRPRSPQSVRTWQSRKTQT
ncbi:hypothetical protein BJ170DRAFT_441372 [Xylariales sp. AK1849]|nr:hypothetical protein BJ170DRAFT_441372 [Xylariales sp. AK1849]